MQGLRVLNTRPALQARKLSEAISRRGGKVIDCPALEIEPTNTRWFEKLPPLDTIDYGIFTSLNAVNYALAELPIGTNWPKSLAVIPIGKSTAKALSLQGIDAYFIPAESRSESLLMHPCMQTMQGKRVLLFKGEGGRECIRDTLRARGAECIEVEVYRRLLPLTSATILHGLNRRESVDIMLMTSQEAMQNIMTLWGEKVPVWFFNIPCLVISQRLAAFASELGFKTILISSPETILQALEQFDQGFDYGSI